LADPLGGIHELSQVDIRSSTDGSVGDWVEGKIDGESVYRAGSLNRMTECTKDETSECASKEERARLRHHQLFGHPQRIAPLSRDDYAEQIVSATTKLKNAVACKDGPPIPLQFCPEMVATLLRYSELWDRFSMLSAQIQCARAKLPVRERQLAIMRTVWLCGAPYQWGEHLARTRNAGFSDQEIERIKDGSRAAGWNPLDKAIVVAVEEFHADTFVSDATWSTLANHFDEQQLFELLVVIGQFTSVAFVLNSFRIRLEHNNEGFFAR
jgi:4-carboxymuconolactone decarboxylase